jgi:hypothetical protein
MPLSGGFVSCISRILASVSGDWPRFSFVSCLTSRLLWINPIGMAGPRRDRPNPGRPGNDIHIAKLTNPRQLVLTIQKSAERSANIFAIGHLDRVRLG